LQSGFLDLRWLGSRAGFLKSVLFDCNLQQPNSDAGFLLVRENEEKIAPFSGRSFTNQTFEYSGYLWLPKVLQDEFQNAHANVCHKLIRKRGLLFARPVFVSQIWLSAMNA